jgi:predicted DNA-binding transcriptional regulator YafY
MRLADRLFRIVQLLRSGRLITAQKLAVKLEVSSRTVYRDVRDLQLSGMPIEGEAGVGYTLRRDFDLPPLMFTRSEITALVLGAPGPGLGWRGERKGGHAGAAAHRGRVATGAAASGLTPSRSTLQPSTRSTLQPSKCPQSYVSAWI